jgi:hypothetical protein
MSDTTTPSTINGAAPTAEHLSFWQKVKNFLTQAKTHVSTLFTDLLGADAAKKLQDGIVSALKTDAGKIVSSVVTEVQATMTSASGPDKHAFALKAITDQLKAAGHDVEALGSSTLDTLISGAVTTLKDHGFPTGSPQG